MAVSISIGIKQNSQSIANNTSSVTVSVVATWTSGSWNLNQKSGWLKIDGVTYNFTNSFNDNETTTGSKTLFTKTVPDIKHNSNGTKTLYCSAEYNSGVSSGTVRATNSATLTTIPRRSEFSIPKSKDLGVKTIITVTRKSSSFTHTIDWTCGKKSGRVGKDKDTDLTPEWTPPIELASQYPTRTSIPIYYKITTYNGNTAIGEMTNTVGYNVPSSVKPSCKISVSDLTDNYSTYGAYVQGLSKLKIDVSATKAQGAAIKSYKVTVDGTTYAKGSVTTGVLTSSGTVTIAASVTDERGSGRTGIAEPVKINVLEYSPPKIDKLSVHRCNSNGADNDQGEYVRVDYETSISGLNNKNTSACMLKYKRTDATSYTSTPTTSGIGTAIFKADVDSSYDVVLDVLDNHNVTSRATSVSTAFTILHFKEDGTALGIGKMAEISNVLDIGMQTRFSGGILNCILEPETDLNEVRIPNTYIGANISSYHYTGLPDPVNSGTFTLEVVSAGEVGQVKQKFIECKKADSRTYERFWHKTPDGSKFTWGDWICTSDFAGTLLWSDDAKCMTETQTITLAEPISKQRTGVVLIFCGYNPEASTVHDYWFSCHFVPKYQVAAHPGGGVIFFLTTSGLFSYVGSKYIYFNDTTLAGNTNNDATGTTNGITYNNNRFVLRHVIGV